MSNVRIEYDGFTSGIKSSITNISASEINENLSNITLLQGYKEVEKYITLEHNLWKLDGTYKSIEENVFPYISNQISSDLSTDGKYYFEVPITLSINLEEKFVTSGITIECGGDSYCTNITIQWYNDDELILELSNLSMQQLRTSFAKRTKPFNKIVLIFFAMNKPNRFLKISQIDYGIEKIYTDNDIYSVDILEEISPISNILPINTLNFIVTSSNEEEFVFLKGQEIRVFKDNKMQGKFYLDEGKILQEKKISFFAVDVIDKMRDSILFKKFYLNTNCVEVIKYITRFRTIEINPILNDIFIRSILISDWAREAEVLSKLLLGADILLKKKRNGVLYFTSVEDNKRYIHQIPDSHLLSDGRIERQPEITSVTAPVLDEAQIKPWDYYGSTFEHRIFTGNYSYISPINFYSPQDDDLVIYDIVRNGSGRYTLPYRTDEYVINNSNLKIWAILPDTDYRIKYGPYAEDWVLFELDVTDVEWNENSISFNISVPEVMPITFYKEPATRPPESALLRGVYVYAWADKAIPQTSSTNLTYYNPNLPNNFPSNPVTISKLDVGEIYGENIETDLAKRLMLNYYQYNEKYIGTILFGDLECGDVVKFNVKPNVERTGIIEKIEYTLTNKLIGEVTIQLYE